MNATEMASYRANLPNNDVTNRNSNPSLNHNLYDERISNRLSVWDNRNITNQPALSSQHKRSITEIDQTKLINNLNNNHYYGLKN